MSRNSLLAFLFVVGLMCSTTLASITLTDTATFGSAVNPISSGTPFSLSLAKFDTNLGELDSIEFRLNFTTDLTLSEKNYFYLPANSYATGSTTVQVTGPTGLTASDSVYTGLMTGVVQGYTQNEAKILGTETVSNQGASSFISAVDWNQFEGGPADTFSIAGTVTSGVIGTSDYSYTGLVYFYVAGDAYGTGEVVYTYNTVPEPSSLAMIAAGAGMLLARRRRR